MKTNIPFAGRQGGISLITTLVLLLAITSLGISAMMVSRSEFVMSGNLQFQSAAMNEAEASVATGEQWLASGTNYTNAGFTTYSSASTPYLYPINYMTTNSIDPLTMTWSDTNSLAVSGSTTQRYLIEMLGKDKTLIPSSLNSGGRSVSGCTKVNVYRVVAYGSSARGSGRLVQSIFSKLSCT